MRGRSDGGRPAERWRSCFGATEAAARGILRPGGIEERDLAGDDYKAALRDLREALDEQRGGEVVLRSGERTGRVFFVKGRIAWATASTVKRTFVAHLVEDAALDRAQLQEVFDACRNSGANFGETIVERGLLAESRLRELLLHHISDCLLEVFRWPSLSSMFVPESRTYKGSLTFALEEVLQKVLGLDTAGELPFAGSTVEEILAAAAASAPAATPPAAPHAPPRRGRSLIVGGAVALLLLAGGVAAWALLRAPPLGGDAPTDLGADTAQAPAPDAGAPASQPASLPASQPDDVGPRGDAGPDAQDEPARIVVGLAGEGKGSVRVVSQPRRARIYLDGLDTRRRAPVTLRGISAGVEHVIMVHRPRYRPLHRRFKLAPQMEAKLRFKLKRLSRRALRAQRREKPAPVAVRLESAPPGAKVLVNRRAHEETTPTDVLLDPRRVSRVELRLEGFRRWRRRIRPVEGVPLSYRATLRKARKRSRARRSARPARRRRR